MDRILWPHREYATAYLDDMVMFTSTWKKHLYWVRIILQALQAAGLMANPAKCQFRHQETKYLGYALGKEGIRLLIDKIKALVESPMPKTKKAAKVFSGVRQLLLSLYPTIFCAYCFTDRQAFTAPKTVLWSLVCTSALGKSKQLLCIIPVLCIPNFSRRFNLQMDALVRPRSCALAEL